MLLGRGGSDLSASLAAEAVDAELLDIWTDVDGVFTADPRLVPEARRIGTLSYEEAMELAHFGAKVLHPRTLAPVRGKAIPVRVLNSFRPGEPGTRVCARPDGAKGPRGLSILRGVALVDLAGPGLRGVPGVAARAFGALAARAISVILITQASSECAITLCVRTGDLREAHAALCAAFEAECLAGLMDPPALREGLAILSLVGDGMLHLTGLAGGFFGAIGEAGCNVVAIAQGSSERSISAVLCESEAPLALAAAHRRFFGTPEPLEVFLLGAGQVGRQFLLQLDKLRERHPDRAAALRLRAVATSRFQLLAPGGLDPVAALAALGTGGGPPDLPALVAFARDLGARHPVIVDCTSSQDLADAYPAFAAAGFHLVSASKKANSGPMPAYLALRAALAAGNRRFRYETNVGAGLPIIGPLRALQHGGDRILRLEGVLSGTLSFLFGRLEDDVPLSRAVREARDAGFTEPDPREDLSGLDVARKALILHREMGGTLELEAIPVEGALPPEVDARGTVEAFLERLAAFDAPVAARMRALKAEGRTLRYLATITPEGCRVGPVPVPLAHPLAAVRDGENALCFHTEAYDPHPMVVRGYGAGAAVTAAGVLADVLRIAAEVRP